MIQGIHHIALIVSSEDSITFYKQLGFDEFKRIERQYDTVVLMRGHGVGLEIFVDAKHLPRSHPEPLGLRHMALQVDDIENLVRTMESDTDSIKMDWLGEKYCLLADPDGNVIELHE